MNMTNSENHSKPKCIIRNHNGVLDGLEEHVEVVTSVADADVVVLWQDIIAMDLSISNLAHKLGKPVLVIQHGRRAVEDYLPPFNHEFKADKMCVWGSLDKEDLMSIGVPESKIDITGTSVFKRLKGREPHEGVNVLYSPEHWDIDIPENLVVMEKLIEICDKNGWNLKAKVMERHNPANYGNYAWYSNREAQGHLDTCAEAIGWADVLVSLSEMTFEMLAEASDVPVICYTNIEPRTMNGDEKYLTIEREYSNAVKTTGDVNKLEELIKTQLANPNELQNERKDIVMLHGGIHIEDPVQEMVKSIKSLC